MVSNVICSSSQILLQTNLFCHSFFVYCNGIIIGIFVDVSYITGSSTTDINALREALLCLFDMIYSGLCQHYLGMELIRDRKPSTLTLRQISYLKNAWERFGIANSHLVSIEITEHLSKD